jgi:AcrR family transcriptional regulator
MSATPLRRTRVPAASGRRRATGARARAARLPASDRRTQILAAALEVFAEQGFHGTRTRELAQRAGVSEALVFQHFPTKESLIRAIIDQVGFRQRLRELEEAAEHLSPREGLITLAEGVLANLRENPGIFRVVFFGVLETPELAGRFYRDFLSRVLALETKLFARAFAARRGAARSTAPDPAIAARSFHGSLLFYNVAGAIVRIEPLPKDPRALAIALVDIHLPEGAR